jgi:hypothetical protein
VLWVFGTAAGVLQSLFYVPYIRDVLRGSTRPHRGSWAIWCVLSVIVLASQRADGGRWSLVMVIAQLVGGVTILLLAADRGVGGTSRIDLGLGAIAAAGLIGWYLAGDPTVATLCVVLADCTAVIMMLPKTYAHPYSETRSSFVFSAASGVFAMLAVGSLEFGLLLYPAYLTIADAVVVALITYRRLELVEGA